MRYSTIEQGVQCERLKDTVRDAQLRARNWEDHITRLTDNISMENRLLEDLRHQADRTQDHEGFAPDIRRLESKIENLERQVEEAKNNVKEWYSEVEKLEGEMAQGGCEGFV